MNANEKLEAIKQSVDVIKKIGEMNPILLTNNERILIGYIKILEFKLDSSEHLVDVSRTMLESLEKEVVKLKEDLMK